MRSAVALALFLALAVHENDAFSASSTQCRVVATKTLGSASSVDVVYPLHKSRCLLSIKSYTALRLSSDVEESQATPTAKETNADDGAVKPLFELPYIPSWLTAVVLLRFITKVTAKAFNKAGISFPAPLGGCGALLTVFLATGNFGASLHALLTPGASMLAKWLPVFFVPSLVSLPLAGGLGSAAEYLKVGGVVAGGYVFTLLTTAWSVMFARQMLEGSSTDDEAEASSSAENDELETPKPPPFDGKLSKSLQIGSLAMGLATIVGYQRGLPTIVTAHTQLLCLLLTTLASFVFGTRLPKSFTKTIHPLITCTTTTWAAIMILARGSSKSFRTILHSYATGRGAGPLLLGLLGPSVVSFACQMYDRRKLIKENVVEISTAIVTAAFGGLFGTAAAVRLLDIGNPSLRLSLLSRNITSPLAMAIAGILGGDVSFAVSMVVVTGLIGANFSGQIYNALGIRDKVAQGLGIGAAAHGLGAASIASDKDAFPFAAIAMVLTAVAATSLVSIPFIKESVMKLALGPIYG